MFGTGRKAPGKSRARPLQASTGPPDLTKACWIPPVPWVSSLVPVPPSPALCQLGGQCGGTARLPAPHPSAHSMLLWQSCG